MTLAEFQRLAAEDITKAERLAIMTESGELTDEEALAIIEGGTQFGQQDHAEGR